MKKIKLFIAAVLLLLIGCSSVKKATNKVLSNYEATNIVGRQWAKANPCANDTVVKSKSDTVTVTNTAYLSGDTVRMGDTITITKTLQNTVTKFIHDTVTNNIVDKRALSISQDSVSYYKGVVIERSVQISIANQATKDMTKQRNKWRLYFWISIIFFVGIKAIFLIKKL